VNLTVEVNDLIAHLPSPHDEVWATFAKNYMVSNYGLVVNVTNKSRPSLVPWRTVESMHGLTYMVSINDSSVYLSSVVYATFCNEGELLERTLQLVYADGNALNVSLSNIVCRKRRRVINDVTWFNAEDYSALLRNAGKDA
jgi:hypothetical protein